MAKGKVAKGKGSRAEGKLSQADIEAAMPPLSDVRPPPSSPSTSPSVAITTTASTTWRTSSLPSSASRSPTSRTTTTVDHTLDCDARDGSRTTATVDYALDCDARDGATTRTTTTANTTDRAAAAPAVYVNARPRAAVSVQRELPHIIRRRRPAGSAGSVGHPLTRTSAAPTTPPPPSRYAHAVGSTSARAPPPTPVIPALTLSRAALAAREATEAAQAAEARVSALCRPPLAADFEVLLQATVRVSLYPYNDIVIRAVDSADAADRLNLDAASINRSRCHLQLDGRPPLPEPSGLPSTRAAGAPSAPPPRVFLYGSTPHHHLLHVGEALALTLAERDDVATCDLYGAPAGEQVRTLTLLRRQWVGEAEWPFDAAEAGHRRNHYHHCRRHHYHCGASQCAFDCHSAGCNLPPSMRAAVGSDSAEGGESTSDGYMGCSTRAAESAHRAAREADATVGQLPETLRVLRVAAAIRSDAGRCWPGGHAVRQPARTTTATASGGELGGGDGCAGCAVAAAGRMGGPYACSGQDVSNGGRFEEAEGLLNLLGMDASELDV